MARYVGGAVGIARKTKWCVMKRCKETDGASELYVWMGGRSEIRVV